MIIAIIRPHRMHGLLRQISYAAWSVCLCWFGHTDELYKNGWTDRDAV